MRKPQNMTSFHVDDHHVILVSVMQLELVDTQDLGLYLRIDQEGPVNAVPFLKPMEVSGLNGVLRKPGQCMQLPCS